MLIPGKLYKIIPLGENMLDAPLADHNYMISAYDSNFSQVFTIETQKPFLFIRGIPDETWVDFGVFLLENKLFITQMKWFRLYK